MSIIVKNEGSNPTLMTICIKNLHEKARIDETHFSRIKETGNIKSHNHESVFNEEITYSAHSASSGRSFGSLRAFPTSVTPEHEH